MDKTYDQFRMLEKIIEIYSSIGEPLRMLEKIIEIYSSNDDISIDKNLDEILSDLEKVKNKIHNYLLFQEKFEE